VKNLVVISGAGISAESGLKTFRDSNGLWENHDIMEVASFQGWTNNQELVLDFYNQRRKQLLSCQPNEAHIQIAALESKFKVQIITQNVDDLHERAGSSQVLHLHGELLKARSTSHAHLVYPWKKDILTGDTCSHGSQLRPDIVWFGEEVPLMDHALNILPQADILLVIGTSLLVYPAAGLIHETNLSCQKFIIDKNIPSTVPSSFTKIQNTATAGISKLLKLI
jgi:NAD-dependent deacetylase|tara:strand:+ start:2913 stop:3584 length:672 start_codon:yes stop_codon:yes gene_type:complete